MKAAVRSRASAKPRRRGKKRFRPFVWLFRAVAATALIFVSWIGYMLWTISSFEPKPLDERYDVGIVLGAALWRNEPSPGLRERLDHALSLYQAGKFDKLILTGGHDHNGSTIPESEGMRAYMMRNGVPSEDIYTDPEAQSTYDNLYNSQAIMEREGLKRAVIITHEFHSARASDIASYLDYEKPGFSMAVSKVLPASQKHPREVMAFTKWKLDSVLLHFDMRLPDNKALGL
jgi:vancomycin permeability regulator SanA